MGYTSSYGTLYQGTFDSIPRNGGSSDNYMFRILKKNEVTSIQPVICASSPAVHTYLNDEPKSYLKGSELEIKLLNLDNQLPLTTFYSEEDDDWKVELYIYINTGTQIIEKTIFVGYLIQEDCEEVLTDIGHEIKLVFNDNLGLLKNIKVSDAIKQTPRRGYAQEAKQAYIQTQTDANGIKFLRVQYPTTVGYNPGGLPAVGDIIRIENAPSGNGYYTITKVNAFVLQWDIYIEDEMPDITATPNPWFPTFPLANAFISFFKPYNKTEQLPLIDIYWILMYNTGIPLDFAFANMILESSETPPVNQTRILEYVYIGLDTFYDNNDSDSLDEVAEKLNFRFSATLFQSEGKWCLVRWNELRNTGTYQAPFEPINKLYADFYLFSDYSWVEREILTTTRNIGNGSDIEEGVMSSVYRPLKFIEHKYKYSQNENVPFNGNMSELGVLLKEYTEGSGSNLKYIKEYEAIGWRNMWPPQVGWIYVKRYIRVIYDSNGTEEDRYLVIDSSGGISDDRRSVCSEYPIQMSYGDKLRISFEFRTRSNHNGSGNTSIGMPGLTQNIGSQFNWYYVNQDGTWQNGMGSFMVSFNNDWNEWHTASVETEGIPFDGLAFIMLPRITNPNETQTYVKNIEIKYTPFVSGQTTIDGHIHKTTIPPVIKNNESEEIYIDDTQKNYSKGTLFLSTLNGNIRKRTSKWSDGRVDNKVSLGELITRQEHLWRNKRRLKLEGNIWPVLKNQGTANYHLLSMINVVNFLIQNQTYLVFGKLEIDYKENQSKFTAYEMWKNGEQWYHEDYGIYFDDGLYKDKNISYTFKYIYKWD